MDKTIAHLFGPFSLSQEGKTIELPQSSVARSILAYLIYHRKQSHARLKLIGIFWPDHPETKARRALTQALWQIRKSLPDLIRADHREIRVSGNSAIWIDVEEFQMLQEMPEKALEACEIYRGDFLEELYDDWIFSIRQRLKEEYLQTLENVIQNQKREGNYQAALKFARLLADADPIRSEAHQEIMRLLNLLNCPQDAVQYFETVKQKLLSEFDAEPDGEMVTLANEIRHQIEKFDGEEPYLENLQSPQLPLIGRTEERDQLLTSIESIFDDRDRSGGMVVLEGEAGVGKTRLVQEIARDIEWRGGQVLWGSANEIEVIPPYGPLIDAFQSGFTPLRADQISQLIEPVWLQVLLPLFPSFSTTFPHLTSAPPLAPDQERERLVEAFFRLIESWTQFAPLVIILENIQWTDSDTLELLPGLIRRLERVGCVIIGTLRGEDVRSFPILWEKLQAIDRTGLKGRLALSRLSVSCTGELIRRTLGIGQPAPIFETRLFEETQGNPLFVLETLRALFDEELLRRDDSGTWTTPWDESTTDYGELPLPPAVEQVIQRRISRLLPDILNTLQLAAVLGKKFDFRLLRAGSDLDPQSLIQSIQELVRRHFIIETHQTYQFSHDKIRQVVYQEIPSSQRADLHCKIAAVIEENHPGHHLDLAHHYARGQMWERAFGAYVSHAKYAAERYATDAALQAFQEAKQILQEHQPFSQDKQRQLEFEIWELSHPLYQLKGDFDQCRRAMEAMMDIAAELNESEIQIKAQLQKASNLFEIESEDDHAYQLAEETLKFVRSLKDPQYEAQALSILGSIRRHQGRYADAVAPTTQALELYRNIGEGHQVTELTLQLVFIYRDLGDIENAKKFANEALAQAQNQDDPVNLGHAHNAFAWIARAAADHQAEAEHCQAMYEQMHSIGYLYYEGVALNNLSLAYSALQEYQKSIEASDKALNVFQALDHTRGQTIQYLNLSTRYKETGQLDEVRRVLDDGLAVAQENNFADEEARMRMSYAEMLTFGREYQSAMEHLVRAEEIVDELGYPSIRGNVPYRRGQLYLAMGNYADAIADFNQTKALYEEADWLDYAYLAQSYESVCHLKLGNISEAVRLTQIAFEGLGLTVMEACYNHYLVMAADEKMHEAKTALTAAYNMLQDRLKVAPNETARQCLLESYPLHAKIMDSWEEIGPEIISVRLPKKDAPSGRSLRDEEWATVKWTISAPEDADVSGKSDQRKTRLLRLVSEAETQGAAPTVSALAAALDVSVSTIKRDLSALRDAGHTIKTRGSRN